MLEAATGQLQPLGKTKRLRDTNSQAATATLTLPGATYLMTY